MISKSNKATKQANVKVSPISGVAPPADKQFGKPNGNPRHNGAWKKEDTLRYKWEMILKMDDDELAEVLLDPKCGRVERMTAEVLLDKKLRSTEKIQILDRLANQVYGYPKQSVETVELEAPVPLSPRKKNNKGE